MNSANVFECNKSYNIVKKKKVCLAQLVRKYSLLSNPNLFM